MSHYNKIREPKTRKTNNLAGGHAYSTTPEYELASLLVTSLVRGDYYESSENQLERMGRVLDTLISEGKGKFAAQACLYARHTMGMRSITHALASLIGAKISGETWKRSFFSKYPRRPDDMTEVVAHYFNNFATKKNGKYRSLPEGLKAGFRNAFGRFDAYQLAKYRMEGKQVSLVDLVNLLHPKPSRKNGTVKVPADQFIAALPENRRNWAYEWITGENGLEKELDTLQALTLGLLKNTETWEAKVSEAGNAETQDEKDEQMGQAWADLVRTRKIGYMALVKNLRNILETAPDVTDDVVRLLTDENLIRKSLVFPFRYMIAASEIQASNLSARLKTKIVTGLDKAFEISLGKIPEFPGRTLVAVDSSGSMGGKINPNLTRNQLASMFAAVIIKANPNADLVIFDWDATFVNVDRRKSLFEIAKSIPYNGGATNFHAPIQRARQAYDRFIFLSDMQGWLGGSANDSLRTYRQKFNIYPRIYSWDLTGNGTMQFPQTDVYAMSGYSDKSFDLMLKLEEDKNALINEIRKVEL